MTVSLLSVVTAADGAARGESLIVVALAAAAVLALSLATIRRERRELERRRRVQAELEAARQPDEVRAALGRVCDARRVELEQGERHG